MHRCRSRLDPSTGVLNVSPLANPRTLGGESRYSTPLLCLIESPRPNQVPSGDVKWLPYFDSYASAALCSSGLSLTFATSPSTTTSRPSRLLQPVVRMQCGFDSRFLALRSPSPVQKYMLPSSQMPSSGVT